MPTSKALSPSKFFGEERYQKYLDEITNQGTIEGEKLTPEERKEAFKRRGDKIGFESFVNNVLSKKKNIQVGGVGKKLPGGGALMKSPVSSIQKFIAKPKGEEPNKILVRINDILTSILDVLNSQQKAEKDNAEYERKKKEKEKRGLAEDKLEKGFSVLKKAAEKIIAPVKGILDRLIDFFVKIFFGRVIYLLLEWFSKKENQDKVKSIIRFIGDWWPALMGAYILFGTSFGRFTRRIVSTVGKFIFEFGKKAIPSLMRFAAANPVTAALVAGGTLAAGGAFLASQQNEQKREGVTPQQTKETGKTPDSSQLQREQTLQLGLGGLFSGGGLAKNFFHSATGGHVSGQKGVDKVPAMLTDGEFVMSRGAVQKYGVDTLEAMNAAGGGTNRPRMVQGTTFAQGGGYIGSQVEKNEKIKDPILEKRKREDVAPASYIGGVGIDSDRIGINERLRRIESQMQVQKALTEGKGINIKGASFGGVQLGTGYGAKYQGRDSVVIKGGAKNFSTGIGDKEITLAGKRYYAQRRGDDVIYSVAKSGGKLVGGAGLKGVDKKKLPPTQIMMGGDGKPFVGFLAFEKGQPVYKQGPKPGSGTTNPFEALGRMINPNAYKESDKKTSQQKFREGAVNSLDYYRKRGMSEDAIKRQMKALGQDYDKAKNDLSYRNKRPELIKQGKLAPSGKPMNAQQQMRAKISANQSKKSAPKPVPPKQTTVSMAEQMKRRTKSRRSGSSPSVPNFSATASGMSSKKQSLLGVNRR